jgi:ribosomal protein S18 acetylase RimI-like enzyme
MDLIIRRAKPKDAKGLARLYLQFWEPHRNVDPLIKMKNKNNFKSLLTIARKEIKRRNLYIFVAVRGEKVVGFLEVLIKKNDEYHKIRNYGYFSSAVTHRDHRGQGIAKALTIAGLNFLKAKGIEYVRANVYNSNKIAMRTWQRLGFKPQSTMLIMDLGQDGQIQ